MAGWKSQGHRANILNCEYVESEVGVFFDEDELKVYGFIGLKRK